MKLKSVSAKKIGSYPWVPFDELWVELEANKSSGCIYASFNSVRGGAFIAVYGTEGILNVNEVETEPKVSIISLYGNAPEV